MMVECFFVYWAEGEVDWVLYFGGMDGDLDTQWRIGDSYFVVQGEASSRHYDGVGMGYFHSGGRAESLCCTFASRPTAFLPKSYT